MRQKTARKMKGLRRAGLFFVCVEVALSGYLFRRNKAWVLGVGYFSIVRILWVCVHSFCKSLNLSQLCNCCLSLAQQKIVVFIRAQWIGRDHIWLQVENGNLKRLSYFNEVLCFRRRISQLILGNLSSCSTSSVGKSLLTEPSFLSPLVYGGACSLMPFNIIVWFFVSSKQIPFISHCLPSQTLDPSRVSHLYAGYNGFSLTPTRFNIGGVDVYT